jgi:hypothetical protein
MTYVRMWGTTSQQFLFQSDATSLSPCGLAKFLRAKRVSTLGACGPAALRPERQSPAALRPERQSPGCLRTQGRRKEAH